MSDEETVRPDIKLGYIFILNDENNIETLKENLLAISDKSPLWIGVSNLFADRNQEISSLIESTNPDVKYNIISNYENIDDLYKLDQFIKEYKNGWTLANVVGKTFNANTKDILTKYINDQKEVFCLIVQDKEAEVPEVNNLCYFNFIYVYLRGNCPEYIEEDDSLISKSILDKVRETQKEYRMIRNWEELT